jgi:hypothetical protein
LQFGNEPVTWEIYRGDSFQVEISKPEATLLAALKIKAAIKQIKGLDVRLAIGIGNKDFEAGKVTENSGTAYIFSGEEFEGMKQSISIKTPWTEINSEVNVYIGLCLIAINSWTAEAAKTMETVLNMPEQINQTELGKKLGVKQSAASRRLARAHCREIMDFEKVFHQKIKKISQL